MYVRGLAYLQLKNGSAAAREFRSIVDHPNEVPASLQLPLATLGLARASVLANDRETARNAYKKLIELWRDGDATLQPLVDAKAEYSRLQ
jgi:hypothetical protein